jgi:hypothetical protein
MHNLYTLKPLKIHIKTHNTRPYMFRSLMKPTSGSRKLHFVKLLNYDPLIYIRYKIVWFVAVRRTKLWSVDLHSL